MRRIVIWLASTVTVVVLLFGYHTSTNETTSGTTEGGTSGSTTSAGNEPSASPSSPSSGSSGSPSTKITTYTGSVTQTRWGPVQVKISVQGGKLTKVAILQHPSGSSRDAEINDYALPILINESLKAQSANIDMVSGATVTSGGYVKSLQAALDGAVSGQGAMGAGPGQYHGAGPQLHVAGPQHRHGEQDDDD